MLRFALIGFLVGCGGQLSEEEAQDVFTGTMLVTSDVQGQVSASLGSASGGKGLTVEGSYDDATISGELEGTGLWTGTIIVEGSASMSTDSWAYDLSLEFQDVETTSPSLTLNGTVDTSMSGSSGAGGYHYEYALAGDLDVSGDANGNADFDFSVVVDVDPTTGTYTYEASGDIAGHDVSGMTGSMSAM